MEALWILREHINIHQPVNPWDCTNSQFIQNIPSNHPILKLLDPTFQTEDSIFWWRKSHWKWWTYHTMAAATLNVMSWHIRNLLLLFIYHCKFYLCANFPGSRFTLSRNRKVSITQTFHDCKYLLLRSSLVFYILTKKGECWIPSPGFHLVPRNMIVSRPKVSHYFLHFLYWITNSKSPLYSK